MHRGEDAKRHGLLRFELFRKVDKFLSLNFRNILISPLEGEKKFLGELNELRNFREGYNLKYSCPVHHETVLEPSPAFVMLTGVRKRLLPLTKREGCDSVISSDFKSKISITNENNLSCKDLSYFGRSALLCRQGKELSALVPQYLSNFSDTVFSRFTSHFSRKRIAFTLAEVLTTLGIIGVVAALTLPSLIQKQQDKATVSRLEKIYSVLSQASLYAREEHGDFEDWNIIDNNQASTRENFAYFEPYLKILRKCDNKSGCWAEQTQSLSGQKARWSDNYKIGVDYISITLNDGTNVVYDFAEPSLNYVYGLPSYVNKPYIVFLVDVNGNRRPNKWGRDIFAFILGPNGIIPGGIGNNSANCDPNKKSDVAGYDCAYRVLKEKAIKY